MVSTDALQDNVDDATDLRAATRQLVAGLLAEPWGQVSPSVYETGRLVRLAPWLPGHADRVRFIVDAQHADGRWGWPDGYDLVPTLSATEALVHCLLDPAGVPPGVDRRRVAAAAGRGLRVLAGWLAEPACLAIPDTPAIEVIVPALVAAMNVHLERLDAEPSAHPDLALGVRLHLPAGLDGTLLTVVRSWLAKGAELPAKLLHSLEVAGTAAAAATLRPEPPGVVGASPAATAAWLSGLGSAAPAHPAAAWLAGVAARLGGPVPSVTPITVFERAWVLGSLADAGLVADLPTALVDDLSLAVDGNGTPGGAGLPVDADTTGMTLFTLGRLGRPVDLVALWPFEAADHFCTWHGERTPSTTTNAHVLDALVTSRGRARGRRLVAATKVANWLCEQQRPDGSWVDKWHASPYYATACCVLALHRYAMVTAAPAPRGATPRAAAAARMAQAVRRAVAFLTASQRLDGSWGRWAGTAEETSYAMRALMAVGRLDGAAAGAATRGHRYLSQRPDLDSGPPLWHDKDLYMPVAVVRAGTLAAQHMARQRPDIVTQTG